MLNETIPVNRTRQSTPRATAVRLVTTLMLLLAPPALASDLKHEVDVGDLQQATPEGIDTLKDTEHDLFNAKSRLEAAQKSVAEGKAAVSSAKDALSAKKADRGAADAELDAAKANKDEARIEAAKGRVSRAKDEVKAAEDFLAWTKKDLTARKAVEDLREGEVVQAEAQLELKRVQLLADQRTQASEKYAIIEFREQLAKATQKVEKLRKKADKKLDKAQRARP